MMSMMLTMPTGSDTQSGFDIETYINEDNNDEYAFEYDDNDDDDDDDDNEDGKDNENLQGLSIHEVIPCHIASFH